MGKALVNKHFAGLFNGISQQAPTLRLETQAENQVNGWSSLVYGLMTRPPSRYVASLSTAGTKDSLFHSIKRDSDERYIVGFHKGGSIKVNDLNGVEYPIIGATTHKAYLNVPVPKRDLAVTTISDYTFIVNKLTEVEMASVNENVEVLNPAKCTVTANGTDTGTFYIQVDGSTIASVTGTKEIINTSGNVSTITRTVDDVMNDLRNAINSYSGLSATQVVNGSFTFRKVNGSAFTIAASDNMTKSYTEPSTTNLLYDTVAYIYIAKGVAEQDYAIYLNDSRVALYTSETTDKASTYKTDTIASNLYSQLSAVDGFSVQIKGSVMKLWKTDGSDFTFRVQDSWGDMAIKGFKGQAQAFKDLPPICFDNAVIQIVGKTDSDEGSYWVKYVDTYIREGVEINTTGVWKESREPSKPHKFNPSTMPIQLVRRQDVAAYADSSNPRGIYFTVEPCLWSEREVGDETSAPAPSFVGQTINDIFLFSNRLGVLTGQSVCMTRAGDFFSFFPSTVTDVLDDDPIDIDAPTTDVTTLSYAIPSRDHLMIFADTQQFLMSAGGEPLTAKTANIVSILSYPCDNKTKPVAIGQMAYFASPRGNFTGIREYFIQSDGLVADAPNVAEHVPTLIPSSAEGLTMCSIPNEDIIMISDGSNKLYVYKFNWSGDQKTQSSWSIWEFTRNINSIHEFNNNLFIIFNDKSLEKISLVKDLNTPCVDSYKYVPFGTTIQGTSNLHIYDTQGNLIKPWFSNTTSFIQDVYIGYPYKFVYEFSPMYLKANDDMLGDVEAKALFRKAKVFLEGKTSFKLKVNDKEVNNTKLVYDYETPPNRTGRYDRSFLIRGDSSKSTLEIESTSSKPVILQSVSFELLVSQRSQRI